MELVPTKKRLGRLYEAKQEGDDITVHIKVTTTARQNFPELKPGFKVRAGCEQKAKQLQLINSNLQLNCCLSEFLRVF